MKHGVIITGGKIETDFASGFLQKKGFSREEIIAVDKGLLFCAKQGIIPGQIVGDFDSLGDAAGDLLEEYASREGVTIHRYPPEKDWIDTELALDLALQSGWNTIWILGGTGTRLDHVTGCIRLLSKMLDQGADCYMADANNLIYMRRESFSISAEEQWGKYVSLFPFGGPVKDLSLEGFVYPLSHVELHHQPALTVSNEIAAKRGLVTFESGTLLVMETKD